jgi:hypothetical protein
MDDTERFPIIVNVDLSGKEKEKLLMVLSKHCKALGYSMKDVKGIHPSIYSHAIPIKDGAKPIIESQQRLHPASKNVVLTPQQRAMQLAKRKGRRHAQDHKLSAAAAATLSSAAQQEETNARVTATTREALLYLGLNPGHHGLVSAVVAAASMGSSAFPRVVLPELPRASPTQPIPGFHVYPQASRFSGECSPEVSVVAPSTRAPRPWPLTSTPYRWPVDHPPEGRGNARGRYQPTCIPMPATCSTKCRPPVTTRRPTVSSS